MTMPAHFSPFLSLNIVTASHSLHSVFLCHPFCFAIVCSLGIPMRPHQPRIDFNLYVYVLNTHAEEKPFNQSKRKSKRASDWARGSVCAMVQQSVRLCGIHWCIRVNPLFRQWLWMLWRWRVGAFVCCSCLSNIYLALVLPELSLYWTLSGCSSAATAAAADVAVHFSKCLGFQTKLKQIAALCKCACYVVCTWHLCFIYEHSIILHSVF